MSHDPRDAAIATKAELNQMSVELGTYLIAQNATDTSWIELQRHELRLAMQKARKELRHVDSALQRLEFQLLKMGKDNSTFEIEREYTPLEGWVLTLIDNYAALCSKCSEYVRQQQLDRLRQFTDAAILNAKGNAAGTVRMRKVKDSLGDMALLYH